MVPGPAAHHTPGLTGQSSTLRIVVLVQTPLLHIATHIQHPYRRSTLWIQADRDGAAQTILIGIGVFRMPLTPPGIFIGWIPTGSGLLPFPLGGQAYLIPQACTQPAAEGNRVVPGDVLGWMIVLLAVLLTWLLITRRQSLPPVCIPVAIRCLEKAAVLRPGNRIFADLKRLHGECPGVVFKGDFPCWHR